jgi:hypothetical protein
MNERNEMNETWSRRRLLERTGALSGALLLTGASAVFAQDAPRSQAASQPPQPATPQAVRTGSRSCTTRGRAASRPARCWTISRAWVRDEAATREAMAQSATRRARSMPRS